ncbi:MAG TPA: PAS domain S-box protein [Ignavibacteria bacterium]|jgi:PAS domain S-box-containing protein
MESNDTSLLMFLTNVKENFINDNKNILNSLSINESIIDDFIFYIKKVILNNNYNLNSIIENIDKSDFKEAKNLFNKYFGSKSQSFELFVRFISILKKFFNDFKTNNIFDNENYEKYFLSIIIILNQIELGILRDSTKLVDESLKKIKTTQYLAQEKKKQLFLLENTSIPIILIDKFNNILFYNKASEKILSKHIFGIKDKSDKILYKLPDWLIKEVIKFKKSQNEEIFCESVLEINKEKLYYNVNFKKLPGTNEEISILLNDITYIKQTQELIRKLAYIVEQSPNSVLITDLNGSIEYVNETFSKVTGYTLSEVFGKNPNILKSGLTPIDIYQDLWNTILGGNEWKGTLYNKKKNGDFFWEDVYIFPLRNNEGSIINFCGIKIDITEKKLLEEATKENDLILKNVWDLSHSGMRIANSDGFIIKVNPSFCKMFEKSEEELINQEVSVIYLPIYRDVVLFKFKTNFSDRKVETFLERELILWNGKHKWFEINNAYLNIGKDKTVLLTVFRDITERKFAYDALLESQNRLKESEKKFRQLVESANEGILMMNYDYSISYVNNYFCNLVGYNESEIYGKSLLSFLYEKDLNKFSKYLEEVIKLNTIKHEIKLIKKDGSIIYANVAISVIYGNDKKIDSYIILFSNITERIKFENELKYEKHLFLSLLNNIPDFIYYKDTYGKFLRVNLAFAKWMGYEKPDEIIGKTDYDFFEKELADSYSIIEKKIISTGKGLLNFDEYNKTVTGKESWVTTSKLPLKDEEGNIIGILGISRDITERKLLEKLLWSEKEELKITLKSVGDAVITANKDRRITFLNKKAEEITGFSQDESLNKPLFEVFVLIETKPDSTLVNTFKLLSDENLLGKENQATLIAKNKEQKIISYNASAIISPDNEFLGYVIVFRDITNLRKQEAQRALSQKMESIGQLAAGISHEINTPMQFIGDNIRFLHDALNDLYLLLNIVDECQKNYRINKNADVFIEKIDELKQNIDYDFIKEEIPNAINQSLEGVNKVRKIVLAMKDFAHPGVKTKSYSDLNRGIEVTATISKNEWKYYADLELDLDQDLPLIYCSLDEINQVILNMIVNSAHAIKDTIDKGKQEKGKIIIKTYKENDDAVILISDTGCGIPENIKDKIFDPFFTTKEVGKGTGQGLAIAHDIIVNKHKGKIEVESFVGKGTTFKIYLPISTENEINN